MALGLITNTSSSVAQRNLDSTNKSLNSTLEKLSSGLRVNRASDDVAAMAIGSRLNAELEGLRTVATNAGQATSLMQIAEGAYARTNDILVRMKSLAAQSANGTLSATERSLLDVEFQALVSEIDRLADDTKFNGNGLVNQNTKTVTDGSDAGVDLRAVGNVAVTTIVDIDFGALGATTGATITITGSGGEVYTGQLEAAQLDGGADAIGAGTDDTVSGQQTVELTSTNGGEGSFILIFDDGFDADAAETATEVGQVTVAGTGVQDFDFRVGTGAVSTEDVISTSIRNTNAQSLGLQTAGTTDVDITTVDNSDEAVAVLDAAINAVVEARANIGADQNRVETARTNLATTIENTEAAKSSYLDADIPSEITKFTAQQVLLQSGISTLAQANQIPQNLLSLFQ